MAKSKLNEGWVGPLKQDKSGKQPYYCEYILGGKKRRHACGVAGKKKDALAEWVAFRQRMESKTHTPNSTRTFGDALDEYERWCEERWRLKQMAGGSVRFIEAAIRRYIRPALGHIRLKDLDTHMIQEFLNDLAGRYRVQHVHCHMVIKETLKRAVFLDHLAISPWTRKPWTTPTRPESQTSIPTLEEGRTLWRAIQERGYREGGRTHINAMAAIALAMFGGCEKGVVTALMWEDIDWIAGAIHIRRSWSAHRDGIKAPKNKYRVRTIPMSQEIRMSLTTIWECDGRPSTGYVFNSASDGSKPWLDQGMSRSTWFRRRGPGYVRRCSNTLEDTQRGAIYAGISSYDVGSTMVKAGFVDENGKARWSFHELRHYAGSIWLEAGAPIHDVSRMLGHSNTKTTEKYYIHYFKKQEAERHMLIADKVSAMHQLPGGNSVALPAPMREKCEVDGQAIDIND